VAAADAGVPGAVVSPMVPLRLEDAEREKIAEARRLLIEAANDRPNWQAIPALHAELDRVAGDIAGAIAHLRAARDAGPEDPHLTRRYAEALDRFGQADEAARVRGSAAAAALGGADRLAIDAALDMGDVQVAARRALEAIDRDTADAVTLDWLGELCGRAGLAADAVEALRRAIDVAPDAPGHRLSLIRFLQERKRTDAAEAEVAAALEALPESVRTLFTARAEALLGRKAEAEEAFLAALVNADVPTAGAYVDFLVSQGRRKDAETYLRRVTATAKNGEEDLVYWATRRLDSIRAVEEEAKSAGQAKAGAAVTAPAAPRTPDGGNSPGR